MFGRFQGWEEEVGHPNQRDREMEILRERLSLPSEASLHVM